MKRPHKYSRTWLVIDCVLVALVLIIAICVASAQSVDPKVTNTYGAGVDTEAERNSWKGALEALGEIKSANFTAANQVAYVADATLTVTDPTGVEGKGFSVYVNAGTATVGGTAYATVGTIVRRFYEGGVWVSRVYTPDSAVAITGGSITGIIDLAIVDGGTGASNATTARTNLGLGTLATQDASSVSIGSLFLSGSPRLVGSIFGNNSLEWLQSDSKINGLTSTTTTANRTWTLPDITGDVVISGGAQTIAGNKTFSGDPSFTSGRLSLTNGSANRVTFGNNGIDTPLAGAGNSSLGEKIVFYDYNGPNKYAMGIAPNLLWVQSDTATAFFEDATERMRIASGGNVGIGTASPTAKLDIQRAGATVNSEISFVAQNGARVGGIGVDGVTTNDHLYQSAGGIRLYTGSDCAVNTFPSNERVRITSDGKVGIGTTSPGEKLELSGTKDDVLMLKNPTPVGFPGDIKSSPMLKLSGSTWNSSAGSVNISGGIQINHVTDNTDPTTSKLSFLVGTDNTAPTERMYITSNGQFNIMGGADFAGTSLSDTNAVKIRNTAAATVGAVQNSNKLIFEGRAWNSSGGNYPFNAYLQALNTVNNSNPTVDRLGLFVGSTAASPTEKMSVSSNGNVGIGVTAPSTALDINGTISFEGNSGTWNGATIAGNQTFTGTTALSTTTVTNASYIQATFDSTASAGGIRLQNDVDYAFDIMSDASGSSNGLSIFDRTVGVQRAKLYGNGSLTIDDTTFNLDAVNNRLGIGTYSPSESLHLKSSAGVPARLKIQSDIYESGAGPVIYLNGQRDSYISCQPNNTGGPFPWGGGRATMLLSGLDGTVIGNDFNSELALVTNNTRRLTIAGTGNVGIGPDSATPARPLTIYNSDAENQIRIGFNSSYYWEFGEDATTQNLKIHCTRLGMGSWEPIQVTPQGLVGLGGMANPTSMLHLNTGGVLRFESGGTWNGATIAGAQTMSGQVEMTGQAATTANSAMTRGLVDARIGSRQFVVTTADQSITSTTTPTDVTSLSITLETGDYLVETLCSYTAATATPGMWEAVAFSGTLSIDNVWREKHFHGTPDARTGMTGSANAIGVTVFSSKRTGFIRVSAAGTMKIQFYQDTSSADAITAKTGSYMSFVKIAN